MALGYPTAPIIDKAKLAWTSQNKDQTKEGVLPSSRGFSGFGPGGLFGRARLFHNPDDLDEHAKLPPAAEKIIGIDDPGAALAKGGNDSKHSSKKAPSPLEIDRRVKATIVRISQHSEFSRWSPGLRDRVAEFAEVVQLGRPLTVLQIWYAKILIQRYIEFLRERERGRLDQITREKFHARMGQLFEATVHGQPPEVQEMLALLTQLSIENWAQNYELARFMGFLKVYNAKTSNRFDEPFLEFIKELSPMRKTVPYENLNVEKYLILQLRRIMTRRPEVLDLLEHALLHDGDLRLVTPAAVVSTLAALARQHKKSPLDPQFLTILRSRKTRSLYYEWWNEMVWPRVVALLLQSPRTDKSAAVQTEPLEELTESDVYERRQRIVKVIRDAWQNNTIAERKWAEKNAAEELQWAEDERVFGSWVAAMTIAGIPQTIIRVTDSEREGIYSSERVIELARQANPLHLNLLLLARLFPTWVKSALVRFGSINVPLKQAGLNEFDFNKYPLADLPEDLTARSTVLFEQAKNRQLLISHPIVSVQGHSKRRKQNSQDEEKGFKGSVYNKLPWIETIEGEKGNSWHLKQAVLPGIELNVRIHDNGSWVLEIKPGWFWREYDQMGHRFYNDRFKMAWDASSTRFSLDMDTMNGYGKPEKRVTRTINLPLKEPTIGLCFSHGAVHIMLRTDSALSTPIPLKGRTGFSKPDSMISWEIHNLNSQREPIFKESGPEPMGFYLSPLRLVDVDTRAPKYAAQYDRATRRFRLRQIMKHMMDDRGSNAVQVLVPINEWLGPNYGLRLFYKRSGDKSVIAFEPIDGRTDQLAERLRHLPIDLPPDRPATNQTTVGAGIFMMMLVVMIRTWANLHGITLPAGWETFFLISGIAATLHGLHYNEMFYRPLTGSPRAITTSA